MAERSAAKIPVLSMIGEAPNASARQPVAYRVTSSLVWPVVPYAASPGAGAVAPGAGEPIEVATLALRRRAAVSGTVVAGKDTLAAEDPRLVRYDHDRASAPDLMQRVDDGGLGLLVEIG